MDRAALIAELEEMHRRVIGHPATAKCCVCKAANALASDAKLLEELKTLCDREDEAVYAGGALRIPALTTEGIRAIFGWNATKDLHTQTTKGDT